MPSLVTLFDDFSENQTSWTPKEPPSNLPQTIALDTETTGLKWWDGDRPIGISISYDDQSTYLPWGHAGGNLDEETIRRWAQRELRNKHIVGLNVRFDAQMLKSWGVDLEEQGCTLSDVQHSAALLDDHRKQFSMEALAPDYLGVEKVGRDLQAARMKDYHSSIVAPRAESDALITDQLHRVMQPLLSDQDLLRVKELENDVIFAVMEMERNAVPLDRELLNTWVEHSEEAVSTYYRTISEAAGFQFAAKPSDWTKLFQVLKLPIKHYTPGGDPSFADSVLELYDHPLIDMGRKATKIASLRSKFITPYAESLLDDGLLRYQLHQLRWEKPEGGSGGTVTGRFSSSNFNIQQVPKPSKQGETDYLIRRLFIPGKGMQWFSADAAQIEFRLAAHFFNSPKLLKAYADNPHISFHKVVHEMVDKVKKISYDHVKNLNFCLLYGGGRNKVAAMLGVPRAESDQFVNAYYKAFPEARQMITRAATLASSRGYVKTLLGRRSRFKLSSSSLEGSGNDARTYKAFNSVCQGGAADINKVKIVELHKARRLTGYVMRGTVHDETFGDVPDVESAKMVMEILNRQSIPLKVPILWGGSIGPNWAETKEMV